MKHRIIHNNEYFYKIILKIFVKYIDLGDRCVIVKIQKN